MLKSSQGALVAILVLFSSTLAAAEQDDRKPSAADKFDRATQSLVNQQTYELRYKLKKGEEIRWDTEHVATTEMAMAGHTEKSASRTQATRLWRVTSVDTLGRMTFEVIDEKAKMWKQVGDAKPKVFDSTSKEKPDADFADYAAAVGGPNVTISIDPRGQITKKQFHVKAFDIGAGEFVKLPEKPIRIGDSWYNDGRLTPKYADGRYKQVRIRYRYQLVGVRDNLADIAFRTEVLTPIDEPEIMSKIMRHIVSGSMQFDIEAGRMAKKQVACNQRVQGFQGGDSCLTYLYQLNETMHRPKKTVTVNTIRPVTIKLRDGQPVMRK